MKFKAPSENTLKEMYLVQNLPMHIIAEQLKISVGTVYNYLHKYNIPTKEPHQGMFGKEHSLETKMKLSKKNKGRRRSPETIAKISEARSVKGIGAKSIDRKGYVKIFFPDHPQSTKDGYIFEHRLVMECVLGRWLRKDEDVHHINGVRNDNRKENLMVMTSKEHNAFHLNERREQGTLKQHTTPVRNVTTGEEFSSAKAAAQRYGVASTNISRACRHPERTSGGCKWEYIGGQYE